MTPNQQEEFIEQLSESLALKLAKKLREGKISVEQMAQTIKTFFDLTKNDKDDEEIKKFVEDF